MKVLLAGTIVTAAVVAGINSYMKILKKKIKRYVLRNEEIEHYFKGG